MFVYKLKKLVPINIKRVINSVVHREAVELPPSKRAFIFLAADYGNIGDLAITSAQVAYLATQLNSYTVVRVPISRTRTQLRSIKRQISPSDLVTIIGGGNMGSLYPDIEELRQLVIRSFPSNRIICFPQTLDWDDSTISSRTLKDIVSTYSAHRDIHVFARETITRNKLALIFQDCPTVSIGFTPDIVLSATASILGATPGRTPSGILRCLRDDRERALDPECYALLDEALASVGELVEITDTHVCGSRLTEGQCEKLLSDKVNQFSAARLIVTDRLHGMILSVLAGTPCLVLPNSNHKIRQTWRDWLSDQPLVAFMEAAQFEMLPQVLERLLATPRCELNRDPVNGKHFASLKEVLIRA